MTMNPQEDGQPATPITQPAASIPKEQTWEHWKAKYDGAVGTWNQEKTRADGLAIENSTLKVEKESSVLNLTGERDSYKTKFEAEVHARTELEKKLGVTQSALDVTLTLNSADYADVAPLYSGEAAVRVLASMTPEERKATLDAAKTTFEAALATRKAASAGGSSPAGGTNPPPPGSANEPTVGELKVAVNEAMAKGQNSPEYQQALKDYQRALLNLGK